MLGIGSNMSASTLFVESFVPRVSYAGEVDKETEKSVESRQDLCGWRVGGGFRPDGPVSVGK